MEPLDFLDLSEVTGAEAFAKRAASAGFSASHTQAPRKPFELSSGTLKEAYGLGPIDHAFAATWSSERVDRHKDIVTQKGAEFDEWRENPVIFWNHGAGFGEATYGPIGVGHSVFVEAKAEGFKGPRTRGVFSLHRKTNISDEVYRLYSEGILRTHSIGFQLPPWDPEDPSYVFINGEDPFDGIKFLRWVLREDSIVMIPANMDAEADLASDGEVVRALGDVPNVARDFEAWLDTHEVGAKAQFGSQTGVIQKGTRDLYERTWKMLTRRAPQVDTVDLDALISRATAPLIERIEKLETQLADTGENSAPAGPSATEPLRLVVDYD